MIKKIVLITSLIVTLILGCHIDAVYKADAFVYTINGDEIILLDAKTDDLFSYVDSDDANRVHIGQICKIKFDHNGTESNREDDIILSVKY